MRAGSLGRAPGPGRGGPAVEVEETDFGPPALDADGREAVDFGRVGRLSIGMTYADVRSQGVDPVSVAGFGACTDTMIQMPMGVPVILTFTDDDAQLVRIQSMGWTTALIDAEPTLAQVRAAYPGAEVTPVVPDAVGVTDPESRYAIVFSIQSGDGVDEDETVLSSPTTGLSDGAGGVQGCPEDGDLAADAAP